MRVTLYTGSLHMRLIEHPIKRSAFMKRILLTLLSILMLTSCAPTVQEEPSPEVPQATATPEPTPQPKIIGMCLPSQSDFYSAIAQYAGESAAAAGYSLEVHYEDSSSQAEQILQLVNSGAEGILIVPSDINDLSTVLEEADVMGIPVVGLIHSINAKYDCLISPDYSEVGAKIARLGIEAVKDLEIENPKLYALEGSPDSFTMQLIHNGIVSELEEKNTDELSIEFVGAQHFSEHEQDSLAGFESTDIGDANIVFAENTIMAQTFLEIAPSTVEAIITIGSDSSTLQQVKDKTYYASIVISPKQIADEAITQVISAIDDPQLISEYIQIPTGVASESSVDEYLAQGTAFPESLL